MNTQKILAILLLVGGLLALIYGGFSYTSETDKASIGSLRFSVDEQHRINVPVWAGVGAMLIGGILLFVRQKA